MKATPRGLLPPSKTGRNALDTRTLKNLAERVEPQRGRTTTTHCRPKTSKESPHRNKHDLKQEIETGTPKQVTTQKKHSMVQRQNFSISQPKLGYIFNHQSCRTHFPVQPFIQEPSPPPKPSSRDPSSAPPSSHPVPTPDSHSRLQAKPQPRTPASQPPSPSPTPQSCPSASRRAKAASRARY